MAGAVSRMLGRLALTTFTDVKFQVLDEGGLGSGNQKTFVAV